MRPRAIAFALFVTMGWTAALAPIEARQAGAPSAPTLLPATVSNSTVTLQWLLAAGNAATNIQIQAGSAPGLSNIAIASLPSSPATFSADAGPGTYFVRLVALNAVGASPVSNEIVITVGGGGCVPPGTPTGLVAAVSGGSVTLQWNAPTTGGAATGYVLFVGSASGASNLGSFALGAGTSLTSPAPPGQYFVRLVATNVCGNSATSNQASFVIGGSGGGGLSLPAGNYVGTMANHNRFGLPPITSYTLQLGQAVPTNAATQAIPGSRWQDNRGCVKTTGIFAVTNATGPQISVEGLSCNDGDLGLRVTAVNGNVYSGVCLSGGPNCTFQMTRQ